MKLFNKNCIFKRTDDRREKGLMTDEEFADCMACMAHGDRNGLKRVYEEYLKLIFAVCLDVLRQREEAEDVTSEFFIRLINIAGSYKPGNGHRKWLVTIARNMAVDRVRKLDREVLVDEPPETANAVGIEEAIVDSVTLREAVGRLKPAEKEIVDMKLIGGFTFREISDITGRPMGTVTWIYDRAIKKLRRCRL